MPMNSVKHIVVTLGATFLLFLFMMGEGVFATGDDDIVPEPGSPDIFLYEDGDAVIAQPDPVSMENVQAYVDDHIDSRIFASIHLDWKREYPTIILSVTEPLSERQQSELQQLVAKPTELEIRIVDYSEDELLQKQAEIKMDAFEEEGVTIWHTGIDVYSNRVEIGIEPFNEKTAQRVYDQYGDEMITVTKGHEVTTMDLPVSSEADPGTTVADNGAQDTVGGDRGVLPAQPEASSGEIADSEAGSNFFQRIWRSISNWFSDLFS